MRAKPPHPHRVFMQQRRRQAGGALIGRGRRPARDGRGGFNRAGGGLAGTRYRIGEFGVRRYFCARCSAYEMPSQDVR